MRTLDSSELCVVSGGLLQHQDDISQDFGSSFDPVFGQVYQLEGQGRDPSCQPGFVGPPSPSCDSGGTSAESGSGGQYCAHASAATEFCQVVGMLTLPLLLSPLTAPLASGPALACGIAAGGSYAYQQAACN